jgi:DNA-binding MarR family transcriptional regulator
MTDMCPNEDQLLDNQLCFALYATSKAMTQAYRGYLDPLGITYPQYLVFMVLWEQDGIPLKRLGERLYLDSGTLTPLVKRLEKEGFLTRDRAKEDEREIRVKLTAKGRKLQQKAADIPDTMRCAAGVSVEEITRLREEVKLLLQKLQSIRGTKIPDAE